LGVGSSLLQLRHDDRDTLVSGQCAMLLEFRENSRCRLSTCDLRLLRDNGILLIKKHDLRNGDGQCCQAAERKNDSWSQVRSVRPTTAARGNSRSPLAMHRRHKPGCELRLGCSARVLSNLREQQQFFDRSRHPVLETMFAHPRPLITSRSRAYCRNMFCRSWGLKSIHS
jgi:hypothetical protein